MAKAHIIMMPGLGLSSEIFDHYRFPDFRVTKLEWIDPNTDEPIIDYCDRLIEGHIIPGERLFLIGQSFGGVVVQELAKKFQTEKVFLISSIKSGDELPTKLVMFRQFKVHQIINRSVIKNSFYFWAKAYGYDNSRVKQMFLKSISNQSNYYFKWATKTIVNWRNDNSDFSNLVHLHGDRDRTFPIRKIQNPQIIIGGDHLMVVKKREIINQILLEEL